MSEFDFSQGADEGAESGAEVINAVDNYLPGEQVVAREEAAADAAVMDEAMRSVDLTKFSDDQVRDLESGNPELIARALNVAPNEEVVAPNRISLKAITDPEERRALAEATRMLRDGKHGSLKAALSEALGLGQMEESQEDQEGQVAQGSVREIQLRIEGLMEQRAAAKADYLYEKADKLLEEITELKLDLRDAEKVAEQDSYRMQEWEKGEIEARETALELFPDLADESSAFYQAVEDEIVLADHRNDAIFSRPDWPEKIATRVYAKRGGRSGGGYVEPGGNRVSSQIPSLPPRGVRLPGSPVGPAANTAAVSAQSALAQLSQLSLEEQDAVLVLLDRNEQQRAQSKAGR